jgi:hypothetical protein
VRQKHVERIAEISKPHEPSAAAIGHGRTATPAAGSLPPVLQLQQQAGNQAVQQLLRSGYLQAKLAISNPDDPEEREAEDVAHKIMRSHVGAPASSPCSCSGDGEMCEECQQKQSQPTIQRRASAPSAPAHVPRIVSDVLRSPGHPLDSATRAFFEPRFGHDFGHVRLHTDPEAAASARSINALAYTAGPDIVFAPGQYSPESTVGRALLAHELTHVYQNHSWIRRRIDVGDKMESEAWERWLREIEAQRQRHEAWASTVQSQVWRDLPNQSRTVGEERGRIDLALTAQRGEALDAAATAPNWLRDVLHNRGYAGPDLKELKRLWAEAVVAAETLKLSSSSQTINSDARLAALTAIPAFYHAAEPFALAAEEAHRDHALEENTRRQKAYEAASAEYERGKELDRMSQGPAGEPGESASRAAKAIIRGSPPAPPVRFNPPLGISGEIPPAIKRVYAAEEAIDWLTVAADLNRVANGVITLVVASLDERSDIRKGMEHLEALDTRLATLEKTNPNAVRIPAVFYPKDGTIKPDQPGKTPMVAQSIPWQFYLINTGVANPEQPAHSGGEWVLVDLTSTQRFENREPASDFDSARLQQGEAVDPPISMFGELNSRIRFPEGLLYFTLPSGTTYKLETTEPWSLSDWLSAIGIALAAIALVASLVATGGASAPAAVAFYAGLGAAGAGIGSTLANLHEKEEQGILTGEDVDSAMVSIGIDLLTAASMGLGRLVQLPEQAARLGLTGERFIALQRVTQVARLGVVGTDVYQAWSFTAGVVSSLRSIENQTELTAEERNKMRAQLVRRALLTGALLAVALKGDYQEMSSGGLLRISHVDPDGTLVAAHSGEATPHEHEHEPTDAGDTAAGAHASPHADVTGSVHAGSQRAGAGMMLGPETHAVGAAGSGRTRDFYICSDLCAPIVSRLQAIRAVLPRNHPMLEAVKDILSRARKASKRLKSGELTLEAADAVANELSQRISRLSNDSQHFAALMNTHPAFLAANRHAIRQRLAELIGDKSAILASQSERQAASRTGPGRDPLAEPDAGSALETDLLGGVAIHGVPRPGVKAQPLHFDAGNFSHTYAEALVDGLPPGCNAEVPVTFPDGTVGRADRAKFIYDSEGDRIGAHVFEIKPNTPDNIARGERQAQEYVDGLRAEIEGALRAKGKAIPTSAPGGGPLYNGKGKVLTYNQERMLAVMRAVRGGRGGSARMAEYEAIARQVFASPPGP